MPYEQLRALLEERSAEVEVLRNKLEQREASLEVLRRNFEDQVGNSKYSEHVYSTLQLVLNSLVGMQRKIADFVFPSHIALASADKPGHIVGLPSFCSVTNRLHTGTQYLAIHWSLFAADLCRPNVRKPRSIV